jgi:hypothetical protein
MGALAGSGPSWIQPLKDSFPGHLRHFQYGQPGWVLLLVLVTENLHVWLQFLQRPISVGAVYGLLVGGSSFLLLVHFFPERERERECELSESDKDKNKDVGEQCRWRNR